MESWVIWLALFAVLVIGELSTMGLTTIWFAGGALVAMIAAGIGLPLFVQVIVFAIVSGVLLIFTRPIAARMLTRGKIRTNAAGLIGSRAVVKEEIDNIRSTGQVIVEGQEWTARSTWNEVILKPGQVVIIRDISGVKLIVEAEAASEAVQDTTPEQQDENTAEV